MIPSKLLLCAWMVVGLALVAQAEGVSDETDLAEAPESAVMEAAAPAPSAAPTLDEGVGDAASTPEASLEEAAADAPAPMPPAAMDDSSSAAEAAPSESEPVANEAAEAADATAPAEPGDDTGELEDVVAPELSLVEPIPAELAAEVPPSESDLGPVAWDSQGREGRIHVVIGGDTLWDISRAYLGTPWVWPSIWNDNGDIENPHLIYPGDRIWISEFEMRRISADEAEAMLANAPSTTEQEVVEWPAEQSEQGTPMAVAPPAPMMEQVEELGTMRVAGRESVGFISPEQMDAASSIVGRIPKRTLLSQEDQVYVGLGESEAENGDEFTIFRTHEKVFDPDTGELLGFHVEIVGWLEIDQTHPEASLATIRMSSGEIELEDRLTPRESLPAEIAMQPSPVGVEGKISFFPQRRVLMGLHDFVYLNRGLLDGIEVGSPLEVYRQGWLANDTSRHLSVQIPDRVVARMVVVRVDDEASVAVVTEADLELEKGDRFRGAQ